MLQLKLGSKGEVVIPKKVREHLGLVKEKHVILEIKDKTIVLRLPSHDVVRRCEERAKEYNLDPKKLIYGDKLYEGLFS